MAEQYIAQFGNLARTNNTLILPANVADVAGDDRDGDVGREGDAAGGGRTGAAAPDSEATMQIEDSTFIVTGGASGLGAATARMIVDGGGRVVIADLKEDDGRALAGVARRRRATSSAPTCADEASGKAAVAAAIDAFGGLHGLVNCAGIVHGEKVVGKEGPHTLAGFARAININLIGTFNLCGSRPTRWRRTRRTPAASAASSSTRRPSPRSTARSARRPTARRRPAWSA